MVPYIYLLFSFFHFTYFMIHANGKKYVRLYSSAILAAFAIYSTLFPKPFDPFLFLIGWISILDVIVDWKAKRRGQ